MEMDKNLLLAIALSIGVYVAWFSFVEPPHPPGPSRAASEPARASGTGARAAGAAGKAAPPAPGATESSAPSAVVGDRPVVAVSVELQRLKIPAAELKTTPQGAALASYQYEGPLGPVELIPPDAAPGFLSTWPELVFSLAPSGDENSVRYRAKHPLGFEIEKTFVFGKPGQLGHVFVTLRNPGAKPVEVPAWETNMGPGLFTVRSENDENPRLWRAIGLFPPPPNRTQDVLETFKAGEREGSRRWLAVDNRYFIAALLASPGDFPRFAVGSVKFKMATAGRFDKILGREPEIKEMPAPELRVRTSPALLAPKASATVDIPFYLGPKNYAHLKALHIGLERSVNFGWFDSLGRLTLKVLEFLHDLTGNYGWSVVLLTCVIQIALFPLTYKSLKATMAMKKIQPELAKIQQKFKDSPQRLQAEMMELYKSRGVNPLGGCLPMLVQMPVFVALFNTLRNSWELHGASWIFWIHDLSARDPYYILPVFMGGVMYFQNKMNPAVSADPAQAQMMQWMPVVFTFMFMNFPVGVVLYWLTNSLLSVAQQTMLKKQLS